MIPYIKLLLPEISICVLIASLFLRTLCEKRYHHGITSKTAVFLSFVLLLCSFGSFNETANIFNSSYSINIASQLFKILLSGLLFCIILLSGKALAIPSKYKTEYLIFLSCATLGMMILVSAGEFLLFYIALELVAYSTYVMIPFRKDPRAAEASIKYILFGAATSGMLIYGISLVSGMARSTYFVDIFTLSSHLHSSPLFLVGCFLILCGLFFKLSLFPFQFWAPDVYEVAPTSVVTFIATSSKATAAFVFITILICMGLPTMLIPLLIIFSTVSMTLGNTAAIVQKDLKRLFAYSSIAQSGYITVAALVMNHDGFRSLIFYAVIYAFMNLGVFLVIILIGRSLRTNNPQIEDLDGLHQRSPLLAFLLLISVLSLAGIPPLAGFAGKWFLFSSAVGKGYNALVLYAVLNSVLSLYYYLILVKHAYVHKARNSNINLDYKYTTVIMVLMTLMIGIGIYPTILMDISSAAAASLQF